MSIGFGVGWIKDPELRRPVDYSRDAPKSFG